MEDGIAYVVENGTVLNDPGGAGSLAEVPARYAQAVVQSADVCPGECIFVELDEEDAGGPTGRGVIGRGE